MEQTRSVSLRGKVICKQRCHASRSMWRMKLNCQLYTLPEESAADALSDIGPGGHPSGPLFAEGVWDAWVTSRFPAEVLNDVAPSVEAVEQTRQLLLEAERARIVAGEHVDHEVMREELQSMQPDSQPPKFDLTTPMGRVNACHARLCPEAGTASTGVSEEDERRSRMATLPFTRPEEVPISQNHTNQQIHAKLDTIKSAPDVPLAQAPCTTYLPLPPEPQFEGEFPMPKDLFS